MIIIIKIWTTYDDNSNNNNTKYFVIFDQLGSFSYSLHVTTVQRDIYIWINCTKLGCWVYGCMRMYSSVWVCACEWVCVTLYYM